MISKKKLNIVNKNSPLYIFENLLYFPIKFIFIERTNIYIKL